MAGNWLKDWNMRKRWCKLGRRTTCQGENSPCFQATSLLDLTQYAMGWRGIQVQGKLTEDFGILIPILNMTVRSERFVSCVLLEIRLYFVFGV